MLFDIREYVQLLVNPVSGLIEGGAEEHEQVADFKHGIVFNCTIAYFMESGGIHIYLRFCIPIIKCALSIMKMRVRHF